MIALILGIVLFVGVHSLRLVAPMWRERYRAQLGEKRFKGLYSVASLVGLALMVYGYGLSRADPVFLYQPPVWTRHLAILLTWMAFILIGAAYAPANRFRSTLGHPMFAGLKIWAFAHLLANGRLGDVLLFGTLMLWAIAGFAIRRRQDRTAGVVHPPATLRGTVGAVVGGTILWAVFAFWLHRVLIGVDPMPV